MNELLTQFCSHISGKGKASDSFQFSDELKASLLETQKNLINDGISLVIEPIKVKYSQEEKGDYLLHKFEGSYIYGFEKEGIFHEVPGDLSTNRDRTENEIGDITFLQRKSDGVILGAKESFAGNFYGTFPIQAVAGLIPKNCTVLGVAIFIIVVILATSVFRYISSLVLDSELQTKELSQDRYSIKFTEIDYNMVFTWEWFDSFSLERDSLTVDDYSFELKPEKEPDDEYKSFRLTIGDVPEDLADEPIDFTVNGVNYAMEEGEIQENESKYRAYSTFLEDHLVQFFFTSTDGSDWDLAENTLSELEFKKECEECSEVLWY